MWKNFVKTKMAAFVRELKGEESTVHKEKHERKGHENLQFPGRSKTLGVGQSKSFALYISVSVPDKRNSRRRCCFRLPSFPQCPASHYLLLLSSFREKVQNSPQFFHFCFDKISILANNFLKSNFFFKFQSQEQIVINF